MWIYVFNMLIWCHLHNFIIFLPPGIITYSTYIIQYKHKLVHYKPIFQFHSNLVHVIQIPYKYISCLHNFYEIYIWVNGAISLCQDNAVRQPVWMGVDVWMETPRDVSVRPGSRGRAVSMVSEDSQTIHLYYHLFTFTNTREN